MFSRKNSLGSVNISRGGRITADILIFFRPYHTTLSQFYNFKIIIFLFRWKIYEQCNGVAMVFLFGPHWLMFLKIFHWKIVQSISNQLFLDGLLMTHFCYFDQKTTLSNFEIISISNIKT